MRTLSKLTTLQLTLNLLQAPFDFYANEETGHRLLKAFSRLQSIGGSRENCGCSRSVPSDWSADAWLEIIFL